MGTLTLRTCGNKLEHEYRALARAVARTEPVTEKFDASRYSPRAVESAAAFWLRRMEFEHRSTVLFAQLVPQLFEAHALIDCKAVMLRMAQDEVRHTEACGLIATSLGAEARCESPVVSQPLAVHPGCSPEERALRNVIYTTCISEMVAVSSLVEAMESTTDPFVRGMTRGLLADEILHGSFGFHFLEAWVPWLEEHPDARSSIGRYLQYAFAVVEQALGLTGPARPRRILSDDEIALGMVEPTRSREIASNTLEHAVVPGLERFGLDAKRAWKRRTLDITGINVPSSPILPSI